MCYKFLFGERVVVDAERVKIHSDLLFFVATNEFIHKIIVHEADKLTGKRVRKIQIFFNFADEIFIPPELDMPELRDDKVNIKETYVQNDFWFHNSLTHRKEKHTV